MKEFIDSKYCWTTSAIRIDTSAGALSVIGGYFVWGINARGMTFVRYSEVRGVRYTEVRNVWSACGCRQGARSLSVVGGCLLFGVSIIGGSTVLAIAYRCICA